MEISKTSPGINQPYICISYWILYPVSRLSILPSLLLLLRLGEWIIFHEFSCSVLVVTLALASSFWPARAWKLVSTDNYFSCHIATRLFSTYQLTPPGTVSFAGVPMALFVSEKLWIHSHNMGAAFGKMRPDRFVYMFTPLNTMLGHFLAKQTETRLHYCPESRKVPKKEQSPFENNLHKAKFWSVFLNPGLSMHNTLQARWHNTNAQTTQQTTKDKQPFSPLYVTQINALIVPRGNLKTTRNYWIVTGISFGGYHRLTEKDVIFTVIIWTLQRPCLSIGSGHILIWQCYYRWVPVDRNKQYQVKFFWIERILNKACRIVLWRLRGNFHRTWNYPGIQIIHIRIKREEPVPMMKWRCLWPNIHISCNTRM